MTNPTPPAAPAKAVSVFDLPPPAPAVWNHAAILERLGGPSETVRAIEQAGLSVVPSVPTVWMWRVRSRVPVRWLPTVLLTLARRGMFLHDFIVEPPAPAPAENGDA